MSRGLRYFVVFFLLLAIFINPVYAQDSSEDWQPEYESEIVRGRVLDVSEYEEIEDDWFFTGRQLVTVEITTGKFQGHVEELENSFTGNPYRDLEVDPGDQVLLLLETDAGRLQGVNLYDMARDRYLYILVAVFVFAVILIARFKGLKSLITLAFMGFVILRWLLPMILQGYNPLVLTVLFACLITAVTLIIISGLNAKTGAAIAGTMGGLLTAGLFAWAMGDAARLTGFSEEAQMLYFADLPMELDVRGLLFSGIIIGALGAVMDVAMSIASSIAEVKAANPLLTIKGLFRAGFNVGKDVLGTMVNTLILAYTGGALPLLLLFMANGMEYISIINMDLVATEVVRSLAGSMGLLVTVPLTAAVAALLMSQFSSKKVAK